MRILNNSEMKQASGGYWWSWSTSNVMDFIRNITGSGTTEKIDWTSSNTVPSQGVGMGGVFGMVIAAAATVVVGSIIAAASRSTK